MHDCFYCENGEKLRSLLIEICELEYSIVYLNRDRKHKGRCNVRFKEHKTEYFQMTPEENAGYFAELAKVAKAIDTLYHPDKINYATFGDGVPHVHVHVVPKYKDEYEWGGVFEMNPGKTLLTDEQYAEMIEKIKANL